MFTITLNVPTDKVQNFLSLLQQSNISSNNSNLSNCLKATPTALQSNFDKINVHPYFDWDFYNNQ